MRICTLVTEWAEYKALRRSMINAGFTDGVVFDPCDNSSGNRWEPYAWIADRLSAAGEDVLVVCHQDVRFHSAASRGHLEQQIDLLDDCDGGWAVCGPAGVTDDMRFVVSVRDGVDDPTRFLPTQAPCLVHSLDECLLVLNAANPVKPSPSLSGFHLYGTDLALNARVRGLSAYVIDFPVEHLSQGRFDGTFEDSVAAFQELWSRRFLLFYTLRSGHMCLSAVAPARRLLSKRRLRRPFLRRPRLRRMVLLQLKVHGMLFGKRCRRGRLD